MCRSCAARVAASPRTSHKTDEVTAYFIACRFGVETHCMPIGTFGHEGCYSPALRNHGQCRTATSSKSIRRPQVSSYAIRKDIDSSLHPTASIASKANSSATHAKRSARRVGFCMATSRKRRDRRKDDGAWLNQANQDRGCPFSPCGRRWHRPPPAAVLRGRRSEASAMAPDEGISPRNHIHETYSRREPLTRLATWRRATLSP